MVYKMKYAGSRGKGIVVYLNEDPRKHKCECCFKVVGRDIKVTALHHWWYAYQPETVRKNPILALDNTVEVCYGCHQVADALRALLYASPSRVAKIANATEGEPRARLLRVLKATLELMEKTEKNISNADNTNINNGE